MYTEIHHNERLDMPYRYPTKKLVSVELNIDTEETIENNVMLLKSVVREIDPVERMKNYKASDFSLHNLIAIGADKGLREIRVEPSVDMMENSARQFNEISNLTPKNE